MKNTLYRTGLTMIQSPFFSSSLQRFTRSEWSRPLIRPFAAFIHFNQEESKKNLSEFSSLHDVFTRELKEEARSFQRTENEVLSPVDGKLTAAGNLQSADDPVFKVKGHTYSLRKLLKIDDVIERYKHGSYAVLYLAPHNYHRIHAPVSGLRKRTFALGETSDPVNDWGLTHGRNPLEENYRLITELDTDQGGCAVVKVGAVNVNSIQLTGFKTDVICGEQLGYFSFGSTVILLFESNHWDWIAAGDDMGVSIKAGEKLAEEMGES